MADMLQTSLFWRVLLALGAWFSAAAKESSFLNTIRRSWNSSGIRRFFVRVLSLSAGGYEKSVLLAGAERLNASLASRHRLIDLWENSLLHSICQAIFTCGRKSRLGHVFFEGGMTGLLLILLGLYVAVDYVLRDVLSIPVLSSVWDELLLIFSLFWILRCRLAQKNPIESRINPLDFPVLVFLVVGFVLMNIVSPYYSIQISGYRATVQYILWFFIVTRLIRDDGDFMRLYLTMLILAAAIALHGIYQYIVGAPMPSTWVAHAETAVRTRVYSIFGSPNIMGDFMVMFAPMAAALAYTTKDRKKQILAWGCAMLLCAACLFTMSRGAWVAMAAAVVLFILLVDIRLFLPLILGVAAMFLVPFVRTRIGFLFTEDFVQANTNGGRAGRWLVGMHLLNSANPLTGFGLGMFGGAVAMQNQVLDRVSYFYMDNYYMKTLVEMGYLGLGAFILMILGLLWNGAKSLFRVRQQKSGFYPLGVGIFCGLVGVLVHCFFENIFEEPYMMAYFWILAGMLIWLGFLRKNKTT